jgi:hypothetical protein
MTEGIDVTFELAGPATGCYLVRAWNAANMGIPRSWEVWDDKRSRPFFQECSVTLEAADGAAPLSVALGNPSLYFKCTTKRMCAALRALLEVHRETLQVLAELDRQFTGQWVGTNVGNTTSASLGIASAVMLFVVPPVGIGLGVGSAITAGITFTGDALADRAHHSTFRRQLSKDAWNAFVVAGLLKEWVQAQQTLGSSGKQSNFSVSAPSTSCGSKLEQAIDGGLAAGSVVSGAASRVATGVAGACQVLGIAGALIQTGVAIRGWTSTTSGQQIVRGKIQELSCRILQIQHLLATVDRLECPICSENITLADDVCHCKNRLHCYHARCMRRFRKRECPDCGGELIPEVVLMIESAPRYMQRFSSKGSSVTSSCCNVQRVPSEAVIHGGG